MKGGVFYVWLSADKREQSWEVKCECESLWVQKLRM